MLIFNNINNYSQTNIYWESESPECPGAVCLINSSRTLQGRNYYFSNFPMKKVKINSLHKQPKIKQPVRNSDFGLRPAPHPGWVLSPVQLMLIVRNMNQEESLPSMSSESGLLQFCSLTLTVYFSKPVGVRLLSCVQLFVIPWTVACQAPLSTGFSRQEYWSGLSFPSPGNLPDPGIELAFQSLVFWNSKKNTLELKVTFPSLLIL